MEITIQKIINKSNKRPGGVYMNVVEKIGRNIDDAVTEALIELGASRDEVHIEVISKGSKGLLGFGAKEAKVRVSLKDKVEDDIELITPKAENIERIQRPEKIERLEKVQRPEKMERSEKVEKLEDNKKPEKVQKLAPIRKEIKKDSEDQVVATKEEMNQVARLAEGFLYKLLKEMSIEATVTSKIINNNRISVNIEGNNMGVIIGKRGETLDAIQYIVNIIANKDREEYIKVTLDTENYRARREETLRKLAYKLSKKVQQTKKPIVLEPMNPYDRRIIHSALQDSKIVKTHSEGKEPFRKVVISPIYQNRSYK